MGKMDSMKGVPLRTGGKMPKGAESSDEKGERHEEMLAVLRWVKRTLLALTISSTLVAPKVFATPTSVANIVDSETTQGKR